MPYPDRQELFNRVYYKQRSRALSNLAIAELEFLKYPNHKTAICILSRTATPDVVVVYTFGGIIPHHFYYQEDGTITDKTSPPYQQFTWEWIHHWLDNNVAVAIFDAPDYFVANGIGWMSSFYRLSADRRRESLETISLLSNKFPNSKLTWFGISYGVGDAINISQVETQLHKIAMASGCWHVIEDVDSFHQGQRLNQYTVADSKTPVLIIQHEKEVWEKAREEMSKTESLLVVNDVSQDDGHFFRKRQLEVVTAICDWFRDKPIPKIIK